VVAIELAVATEACDRRSLDGRGIGTARAASLVREHVPGLIESITVPDLEALVGAVSGGAFADHRDWPSEP
jgi:hypothetical protein